MKRVMTIDFGTASKLRMHGPNGPILKKELKLPKIKGGKTDEDDFLRVLQWGLDEGYMVVCESPTVGSCGAEPKKVRDLMAGYPPEQFQLIAARAVKNYRLDNEMEKAADEDAQSAEILYNIATTHPERLKVWRYEEDKYQRKHTSVRPMDKRKYRDERATQYLASIPALPPEITKYLKTPADLMPFIMALDEPLSSNRNGYQKVVGLYEHGYPSFYRRATVELMQTIAKDLGGVSKMEEINSITRKVAWKQTQNLIRKFYAICKNSRIKQGLDTTLSAKDM